MLKEKRLVPQLRFSEFEGEWEKKTLFDISKQVAYGMNAAAKSYDGENKYLRITDIDESTRRFIPNPLSSPKGKIEKKYILKKGDIVFTRTGASVGKSYLYDEKDGKLLYAGFLIKFNIINSNPYFVFLQTFRESYRKWVQVYSMRSGQPGLNAEEYKSLIINIPQAKEQQKITNFLSAIDKRIQTLVKKKTLLEQYKKGVMQKIFKQELRFKDDDGAEFYNWKLKRIGKVFKERNEKNFKDMELLSVSISKGIYSQSESNKKDNSNSDKSKYKRVLKDDIAYNSMRMWQGASAVSEYDGIVSPAYTILEGNEYQYSIFYGYLFKMSFMIQTFQKNSQGLTSDTWNLKYPMISKIKINVPSLEEQTKIANFLSAIDRNIELVTKKIIHTKAYKKGLLQQMFV
jgi:type I restriction enzyme S subunit